MAELVRVARQTLPPTAVATHLTVKKAKWGHGGCDGGPPGWTNLEVDERFRATGQIVTKIDARMRQLHWAAVGQDTTSQDGEYPPPTQPGSDLPYIREYESASERSAPVAWLYTPAESGGDYWELDLEVAPAEIPDHDC